MGGTMDFDEAIVSHLKWKIHLRNFLDGRGGKLDSTMVAKDDACELGQWIYGEGKQFAETAPYKDLVKKHAQFHLQAAEVVRKTEAGDKPGAEEMMASGREFSSASKDIVGAIMQLEQEVAKQHKKDSAVG